MGLLDQTPAQKARQRDQDLGRINPALVCPHCQMKGQVRTHMVERKRGISGGKATAAVLTLGWSMLATGLSRKETVTQATCDACHSQWEF